LDAAEAVAEAVAEAKAFVAAEAIEAELLRLH
jgi:hypothetical protein